MFVYISCEIICIIYADIDIGNADKTSFNCLWNTFYVIVLFINYLIALINTIFVFAAMRIRKFIIMYVNKNIFGYIASFWDKLKVSDNSVASQKNVWKCMIL